MEILQLHLKHFGKFTDYRLDLHAGINIISGGNETGKSTLHAFVRAMLFGITRTRSKNLDEYQLREPWDNPSYFAGSMKLLHNGKIYRIDRNFYRREEQVEVVCETDGTKAADPAAAIRLFTGGLQEADFDNTVFIRQAQTESGSQLGERLRDYLVNMEQTQDASLDLGAAMEYLKKKKKRIEREKSDARSGIEDQIREKTQESEYVTKDLERLLEKRSKENLEDEHGAPFERVPDAGTVRDEPQDADGTERAAAGGRQNDPHGADGPGREGSYPASGEKQNDLHGADGGMRENPGPENSEAAGAEEDRDEMSDSLQQEETDGVLLPAAVFLSFMTAVLMVVCAWITTDHRMRYAMAAGAVLCSIVAFVLLRRVLHPVSKTERLQKKMRREEFLNRHLGFREDPDDPADRQEALRREMKARDQILKARAEEERRERELEERRRAQIEKAVQLQEEEDRQKRGRDVERIARSQVLDREISLRRETLDELRKELEKLYREKAALSKYDEQIRAVELAQSRISELSGSICHESGEDFTKEVSALLSALTQGRYTRISLDDRNLVRLNTPEKLLSVDQVSFGTMQQVYFALRLASARLLSGESQVPIILDEPFAMYDEKRLECALRILAGSARQVILFSCQTRELDMLSKMGLA